MAECVLSQLIKTLPAVAGEIIKKAVRPAGLNTPVFDTLWDYKEGQKTMTYAGIGSRETPPEILKKMTMVASTLAESGYTLQSGGAIGADMAFEGKRYPEVLTAGDKNVINAKGKLVLKAGESVRIGSKAYTDAYCVFSNTKQNNGQITDSEWVEASPTPNTKSFSGFTIGNQLKSGNPRQVENANKALAIAEELHPNPGSLFPFAKNLMARNNYQVFGVNLDTPVDFVLFYAEESDNPMRPKGGTGQAVEAARRKGIPTINMADPKWEEQLAEVTKNAKKVDKPIERPTVEQDTINIYSKDKNGYEGLSNLAVRPFTMRGRTFQSVEHAYQSLKSGTGIEEAVYGEDWGKGGLVARGTKGTKIEKNWNTKKLMPAIMLRSFEQNSEAAELLLSTGSATLTHNVADKVWVTKFPELLMQIRDKLKIVPHATTSAPPKPSKKPLNARAQAVQDTAEIEVGGSEDEAKARVVAMMNQKDLDSIYKNMSKKDLVALEEEYARAQEDTDRMSRDDIAADAAEEIAKACE